MNQAETINELKHVAKLYEENIDAKSTLEALPSIQKDMIQKNQVSFFSAIRSFQNNYPKRVIFNDHMPKSAPQTDKAFILPQLVLPATIGVPLLLIGGGFYYNPIGLIFMLIGAVSIAFLLLNKKALIRYIERHNHTCNLTIGEIEDNISEFFQKCIQFDKDYADRVNRAPQFCADAIEAYGASLIDTHEACKKMEQDKTKTLAETEESLKKVEIIHPKYFHLAENIAANLESNRADTLKEAVNMALDDERRDNEEAARRAEARTQAMIMEQRAAEERMHNARMAQIAQQQVDQERAHNDAMERAERDRVSAMNKANQEQERHNREIERAFR